jgi:hypothetical protein
MLSDSNLPNSENLIPILNSIFLLPELLNVILLGLGVYEMHQGIEIGHPVFAVLFVNLIVAFISSVLGLVSFVALTDERFVKGMTKNICIKKKLKMRPNYYFWAAMRWGRGRGVGEE